MSKKFTILLIMIAALGGVLFYFIQIRESTPVKSTPSLERLKYNQSDLVVDLAVGSWSQPLPMDYDDDGDYDLLVVSNDDPYNGLYFFENTSGDVKHPVFKPAVRISHGSSNVTISYDGDTPIVTKAGRVYPDIEQTGLYVSKAIPFEGAIHNSEGRIRGNEWTYVDYNGDGVLDLIIGIGEWGDYGWDNAFDKNGKWKSGSLHGYVYYIENAGTNKKPDYKQPVKIQAGGKPIDVYGAPSPVVADFNGDNKPDIITGEFLDKLTFFENIGTRTKPKYASGQYIRNGAGIIKMDQQSLTVTAIDWTKDGATDLIVGESGGRVALIENTGKVVNGKPIFKAPYFFKQQADYVKISALANPVNVDWDGDGKDDLIVGDAAGRLGFVKNLDGGNTPKWAAPVYLKANGKEIRIEAGSNGSIQGPAEAKWGYTAPAVADWNEDGLPDILVNSIWGKILWYENIGTRTKPKLAAAKPIDVEWKGKTPKPEWNWWEPQGNNLVTQWRTNPYVIDLNEDGLNDLVMLDQEGYLSFFEREKVNGKLKLLPGKRIFIGEKDSSKFDRHGNAISAPKGPIQMNTETAGGSGRRKFTMVDWNRDGKLDLIVNGRPNVKLLLNVGTKDEPFLFRNMGDITEGLLAGHETFPTIVDWDKNDVPDLLIGAEDGHLYYLQNNFKTEDPPRHSSPNGEPKALVGRWNFNEGQGNLAEDSSRYKNFGAVRGAHWVSGYKEKGLSFDGFNDSIDLDYTVGPYLNGAQGVTVASWMKIPALEPKSMYIFGSRINAASAGVELILHGKSHSIQVSGRSQASDAFYKKEFSVKEFDFGEWHHIAAVLDFKNDEIKLYIDGIEQKAKDNAPVQFGSETYQRGNPTEEDVIGRSPAFSDYFNGQLDEMSIFRTALTEESIQNLMQEKHWWEFWK